VYPTRTYERFEKEKITDFLRQESKAEAGQGSAGGKGESKEPSAPYSANLKKLGGEKKGRLSGFC